MKRNFIYSKKSVRTLLLKLEPYFLSHAERGKTFWIREFLAGMRLCRREAMTPFRLPIPISNFGGSERIRTSDTLSGMPLFESGAFNHSATLPYFFLIVTSLVLVRDKAGKLQPLPATGGTRLGPPQHKCRRPTFPNANVLYQKNLSFCNFYPIKEKRPCLRGVFSIRVTRTNFCRAL